MTIDELPEELRAVAVLIEDDLTTRQAAKRLGLAQSTVFGRVSQAERMLGHALGYTRRKRATAKVEMDRRLREIDNEKRCSRCMLRGHEPGDTDRCIPTSAAAFAWDNQRDGERMPAPFDVSITREEMRRMERAVERFDPESRNRRCMPGISRAAGLDGTVKREMEENG